MHTNAGNHLHGGITDNRVWQGWCPDLAGMPSCCYDAPSRKVGRRFVGALQENLCGVQARWWNSEQFIVLKTVMMQQDQYITAYHAIQRQIKKRINDWDDCGRWCSG